MKTLRIKLLTGRSGPDGSHAPGDELSLPIREAVNLIESTQAVAVNEKTYDKAVDFLKGEELAIQEEQAQIDSITKKNQLENELNTLYEEVVLKEAELNGVILESEKILEMVEDLKKRILPITDGGDGASGDGAK